MKLPARIGNLEVLGLAKDHRHTNCKTWTVRVLCCGRVEEKRWSQIKEWRAGRSVRCRACGRADRQPRTGPPASDLLSPAEAAAANDLAYVMRVMAGSMRAKEVPDDGVEVANPWRVDNSAAEIECALSRAYEVQL